MPDITLPRELHAIGQRAIDEALRRGANTVEAEHVLLVLAADGTVPGLGHAKLDAALDAERARSLAFAGIVDAHPASTRRKAKPGWGASIRELLRAADKPTAGATNALERELVIGILKAELGTVPRALALGGVNREALVAKV